MKKIILFISFLLFFITSGAYAEKFSPTIFIDMPSKSNDSAESYSYINKDLWIREGCVDVEYNESYNPQKTNVKCVSDRTYLSKDKEIIVIVRHNSDVDVKINFDEKTRKTKLKSDMLVLVEVFTTKKPQPKNYAITRKVTDTKYILKYKRANLTISVVANGETKLTKKIVTGNKENVFLSADLPITKASQLKYDSGSQSLQENDTPSTFYIGLNYMLGDVLSSNIAWHQRFFGKAMVKFSKQPLDSFGLGFGYRPKKFNQGSFFVAYMFTKEDYLTNGSPKINGKYGNNVRLGVSFNLDRALDWVK